MDEDNGLLPDGTKKKKKKKKKSGEDKPKVILLKS